MISRFLRVSFAICALLAVASACNAAGAGPDSSAYPGKGFGGIGGQAGGSLMPSDADFSQNAQTRMSFAAIFRYTLNHSLRWQISPGFFWAGYSKTSSLAPFKDVNFPGDSLKDDYLTLVLPVTAQLQFLHSGKNLLWHLGAGPGIYRVWIENHRKVIKDPVTLRLHRNIYPGVTAELGAERFFKSQPSTSVEINVTGHYVFAKNDDDFPSGFSSPLSAVGIRIGGNYYFNLLKPRQKSDAAKSAATKKP